MQLTYIFDTFYQAALNDVHKETIQIHPQSRGETSSTKRRKVDSCKASFIAGNDTCDTKLNVIKNLLDNDSSDSSKNNATREHLLLGIFQENTCQEITARKQHSESPKISISSLPLCKQPKVRESNFMNKTRADKKAELIRIFPGPAGLVARMKDDNTSVISYLNSMKELKTKPATEHVESNFSKSSQDEKNLLSEKAWKFLLDDLPRNFFNEYGISIVKSRANATYCNSMKVKFIAGILDYIDHSHNDPFIILKDTTDSIEGTVHRDIPLNYPGILEPNVVVVLHDVGLLKTTTHVVMNKYHILVSQVNLLAVYSNKGRVINTSRMENMLSSISNIELIKNDYITPILIDSDHTVTSHPTSSVSISTKQQVNKKLTLFNNSTSLNRPDEKKQSRKQDSEKDKKICEVTDKIFESFENSVDMDDDMNDAFFTIDPLVLDKNKYFKHLLPESTIAQTSEIQRRELQTRNSNCLKDTSEVNAANKIKPTSTIVKCNVENSKNLINYFTGKALEDSEFDSDDEILSQLDVDSVVNNRKK